MANPFGALLLFGLAEPEPPSCFEVWARAFSARNQPVMNRVIERYTVEIQALLGRAFWLKPWGRL